MKKDYIYQDKGQFKLLQNATRIGGFYAGDQGIVPAERVLPKQKFAHQPIFRRPPEEPAAATYYLQYRDFVIVVEDTGKKHAGEEPGRTYPLLKVKGLVSYQDPTPEAQALADRFVLGDVWDDPGYFTEAELITLATYYFNGYGNVGGQPPQPNPGVWAFRSFKRYGFYSYLDLLSDPPEGSIWSGKQSGKYAVRDTHVVVPSETAGIDRIHFLYQDGNIFGMAVVRGQHDWYYIYTADSLEGPWTETNFIDANTVAGAQSLVALLQKDCGRLLRRIGYYSEALPSFPLFMPGIDVGRSGELVGLEVRSVTGGVGVELYYPCRMRKKDNGIELKEASIDLKFKNGKTRDFVGSEPDF